MGNYIRKTLKYSEISDKNWSLEEDKILLENYYEIGPSGTSKLLNRSVGACRTRRYHLALKDGQNIIPKSKIFSNTWSEEEDNFIKQFYPDKGPDWCSNKLNRTPKACIHRAIHLKVKRNPHWKPEEDEILRQYYPTYGSIKVSELLGKSRDACSYRASVLKIRYNNYKWTDKEIEFIKEYYPLKGSKYVAQALNRTITSCNSKATLLGLKHSRIWSNEEKEFLIKHYPLKGSIWVGKNLNRSRISCKTMAYKLNISFINQKEWQPDEIEIIKKYYPTIGKFVADLLPNRTFSACINIARKLGVSYKKQNSSAIEQIKKILDDKQVIYKQEVSFKECKDKKMLLFDIVIYENQSFNSIIGIIEYDGTQHFIPSTLYQDRTISASDVLKRTQRHDQIKNEFCMKNHIPMLRIKYNQINFEELITLFLKNPSNFINWYNPFLNFEEYYNGYIDEVFKQHYIHFSKYKKDFQYKYKPIKNLDFYFNKWTMDEDLYLEKYFPSKGSKFVSVYLHRSPQACSCRAHKLGLYRERKWSRKADAFLIKNYKEKGPAWIAEQLNTTKCAITHRAHRLNVENLIRKWEKPEDDYLIKYYRIKSTSEIAKNLNRSLDSVCNRVRTLRKLSIENFYTGDDMKVISISMPLACLIYDSNDYFLPRLTPTNYRGELYLHISSKREHNELGLPCGHIFAKCNLINCEKISNRNYIWTLKNIELLSKPIPAKGKVNIWRY